MSLGENVADHQPDPTTTEVDELRVKLPRAEAAFILYLIYYTDQTGNTSFDDFLQTAVRDRMRFWKEHPRPGTEIPPLPPDVKPDRPATKVEPVVFIGGRMAPGAQVTAEIRDEALNLLIDGTHRRYGLLIPADVDFGAVLPSYQRRTELRRGFGISRKDFASLLGVSTRTLVFWETDRDPDPGRDIRYAILLLILEGEARWGELALPTDEDDGAWLRMVKSIPQRRSVRDRRGDPSGLMSAIGIRGDLGQLRCKKCGCFVTPGTPCVSCAKRTDKDAEKQRRPAHDPQ